MKSIILALLFFFSSLSIAQTPKLKFNEEGEFKILQLADIHWSGNPENATKTEQNLKSLFSKEKPQLIVLTGDNVNSKSMREGLDQLGQILESAGTPWTLIFGNHDEEQDLSKEKIYEHLRKFPNFFGEKGEVSGVGNFSATVLDKKGENISHVLYFLDSGDYTNNPKLGSYDWIKQDQIHWYVTQSNNFKKKSGTPVPSLMFFHIPIPEFNFAAESNTMLGVKGENVAAAEVNSGVFAALLEQKDVMGVFSGHDHINNYVGLYKGIALGYGGRSGADSYGDLPLGGRILQLKENDFTFTSYLHTSKGIEYPFHYPSGLTTIGKDSKVLKAENYTPKEKGLNYEYYEGKIESVNEIKNLELKKSGTSLSIDLSPSEKKDHFALIFKGYLKIPTTGYYKFYTYSDDGSLLKIGDTVVVDNDGGHRARRMEGIVALEKGFHKIEVQYFEDYMGETLEVGLESIELKEQPLPSQILYH